MQRSNEREATERPDLPEETAVGVHRQLTLVNHLLGNAAALAAAVRRDPKPVNRILDVGCGYGGMLSHLRRRLDVDVIGVDLRVPARTGLPFPIMRANAVVDPLPQADVAVCSLVAHHLSEDELARLIQNVGRSARRFVLLDLVRSRMPLLLFRCFMAPFLTPLNATDGILSIRKAFTKEELTGIAARALSGSKATFHHSISPLKIRQIVDIDYQ